MLGIEPRRRREEGEEEEEKKKGGEGSWRGRMGEEELEEGEGRGEEGGVEAWRIRQRETGKGIPALSEIPQVSKRWEADPGGPVLFVYSSEQLPRGCLWQWQVTRAGIERQFPAPALAGRRGMHVRKRKQAIVRASKPS